MGKATLARLRKLGPVGAAVVLIVATTATDALAHARPETTTPAPNARLDAAPAHIVVNYDDNIDPSGSPLGLVDATGSQVPATADPASGARTASTSPAADLVPGPYTVAWTSLDANDGHVAQGFYTFVVNGGPVGIINGVAQKQAPAADLMATLTVTAAADGSSLLRVDLNNSSGVERVRIRLSRPDLGEDLLDTQPSGDGGWVVSGNEVAVPGAWRAVAIVRRTNIFDDAQAAFDFSIDPTTGEPSIA
jgi:copper resistance protein C